MKIGIRTLSNWLLPISPSSLVLVLSLGLLLGGGLRILFLPWNYDSMALSSELPSLNQNSSGKPGKEMLYKRKLTSLSVKAEKISRERGGL